MIDRAIKIARRSPQTSYQTGAVIVSSSGEELAVGWSHMSHVRLNQLRSLHAEIHAIVRGVRADLQGAEVYIATISKRSGEVTSARPCITCATLMQKVGIRRVHYTTKKGSETLNLQTVLGNLKNYVGVGM